MPRVAIYKIMVIQPLTWTSEEWYSHILKHRVNHWAFSKEPLGYFEVPVLIRVTSNVLNVHVVINIVKKRKKKNAALGIKY